jgi:CRP-like cAMP-binding protein
VGVTVEALARVPLLADVPAEALAALAAQFEPQRLDDGAYLFHAEEPADRLYLIGAGSLEVVLLYPAGNGELLLNTLPAG